MSFVHFSIDEVLAEEKEGKMEANLQKFLLANIQILIHWNSGRAGHSSLADGGFLAWVLY